MYVKAVKPGMYDLAKNGGFVNVVLGTVFEVPDSLQLNPGDWIVRCDQVGNILDIPMVRNVAEGARALANRLKGEAALAAKKAKDADVLADAEEAKVQALEDKVIADEKAEREAEAKAKAKAK